MTESSPSHAVEEASPTDELVVPPGGEVTLHVRPVVKTIGDEAFTMLSYGGSIPGPTLRVRQGSRVSVHVANETDMETTVHWHGLRFENRYDGVPHETQAPIPPGGTYTHELTFPDAGLFWYHPHMREDYAQEMGLYGNVVVEPEDDAYWPEADRELVLTLDDILVEDGRIASFDPNHATFAAMGRFGNVLLTAGEVAPALDATAGEVVRLMLTNTANTRVFKVSVPGARMKLIGSDGGRYERETWIEHVTIAPSERAIVDVRFERGGRFSLDHVTPGRRYKLAAFEVSREARVTRAAAGFDELRINAEMVRERAEAAPRLEAAPDKTLALVAEMDAGEPAAPGDHYVCPMHPEVTSTEPGNCPKCGMKLMASSAVDAAAPDDVHGHEHHHDHAAGMADGIEWEDTMVDVNRVTTSENMRWKLVDRDTGKANGDIDWSFDEGDLVKIRLVNEMESDHPMHHPFHVHGERFLVLARDGVPEDNAVWKDTVLIRTGEVVDVLMDASNPGLWMAHCHIAEHMESGMMFEFRVSPMAQ